MNRLEEKALKIYGKNIDIIDVDIGGMNALTTSLIWGVAGYPR
ncbi:hypothetical protein [Treponema bryantii]|nr:hypothetical protein [Treponema bryantii]